MVLRRKKLRLTIGLTPSSVAGETLYAALPSHRWEKLRKQTLEKTGYLCGICKAKDKLNCHEIWKYDEKKRVAKLVDLMTLCDSCHRAHHISLGHSVTRPRILTVARWAEFYMQVVTLGLRQACLDASSKLGSPEEFAWLMTHFMKVNKVGFNVFIKHLVQTVHNFEHRNSVQNWKLDFGKYKTLIGKPRI